MVSSVYSHSFISIQHGWILGSAGQPEIADGRGKCQLHLIKLQWFDRKAFSLGQEDFLISLRRIVAQTNRSVIHPECG